MGESKRRKEQDPNYGRRSTASFWDIRPDRSENAFKNLPPGVTPEGYKEYLSKNWELMGAFAYLSYLEDGRGTVLVDWDLSIDASIRSMGASEFLPNQLRSLNSPEMVKVTQELTIPLIYLGERGLLLKKWTKGKWFDAKWEQLIGRYDPETMIVVVICHGFTPQTTGNMMVRTLAVAGAKTPKQAYEENGDRLQEFMYEVRPLAH